MTCPRHAVKMTLKSGITAMWVERLCCALRRAAPDGRPAPVHLHGSVHGSFYTSAEGGFSVPFPVTADLNGRVLADGAQNVDFYRQLGSRNSFAGQAILEHSPMMAMLEKDGGKRP